MSHLELTDFDRTENVRVALSDGTRLACNIYKTAGGPAPVVVGFYPYHKDALVGSLSEYTRLRFADRGYTTVLVDFRGTGRSSGRTIQAFHKEEGDDAVEVVEWLSKQPWCNGNVVVLGVSYGAITAFKVAAQEPPGLKAIVPIVGTRNIYPEFLFPGSIPNACGRNVFATLLLTLEASPSIDHAPKDEWRGIWAEHLDRFRTADLAPLNWLRHPFPDAAWQACDVDMSKIKTPTYLISGWADIFPNCMDDFRDIQAPKRAVMGPWTHGLPDNAAIESWDWQSAVLSWLDDLMNDPDSTATAGASNDIQTYVGGAKAWRRDTQWPPANNFDVRYLLDKGHTLVGGDEGVTEGADPYTCDPTVGANGPLMDPLGTGLGYALSQERDAAKSLIYRAAPATADVDITGRADLELFVECLDDGDYDIAAKLHDVGADGSVEFIAAGYCHVRRGEQTDKDVDLVSIRFNDTCYRLRAGHSLQVSVAMSDFPYIFPTEENKRIRVHRGGARPSSLRLTAAEPRSDEHPGESVPEPRLPWIRDAVPYWDISVCQITNEVTHTFGFSQVLDLPNGAIYGLDVSTVARVAPAEPASAVIECVVAATITQSDGLVIKVSTQSKALRGSFEFQTTVTEAGQEPIVLSGSSSGAQQGPPGGP